MWSGAGANPHTSLLPLQPATRHSTSLRGMLVPPPSSAPPLCVALQVWNERIQLGPLTTSAAPQMLLEVLAEKMGKGGSSWGGGACRGDGAQVQTCTDTQWCWKCLPRG